MHIDLLTVALLVSCFMPTPWQLPKKSFYLTISAWQDMLIVPSAKSKACQGNNKQALVSSCL